MNNTIRKPFGTLEIKNAVKIQRAFICLKHMGYNKDQAICKLMIDFQDSMTITPDFIEMSVSGLKI